jgi:hypothetical protein
MQFLRRDRVDASAAPPVIQIDTTVMQATCGESVASQRNVE